MIDPHEHLHIRYSGRFVFSKFPRGHVSWCHLKVIQGAHKTLVIFTNEVDNPGTFIANGAGLLATQVTNLFMLEPETTLFLERTRPEDHYTESRQWAAEHLPASVRRLPVQTVMGTTEDKYEQIVFEWSESSDYNESQFIARNPSWKIIKPVEMIRLLQTL